MGYGDSRGKSVIAYYITFLVLLCWFLLFFFPGGMSKDSMRQLEQARAGVYSDAHPASMAVLWRYLDMLTAGPFGMLLLHCLWFLGGLTAIFYLTRPDGRWFNTALIIAVALWPATFFITGVIWKDVAMASAYIMSIALFLWREKECGRIPRALLLALCLLFVCYGVSTRHNGVAAALPLLAYYCYRLFPHTRPVRGVCRALALGVVVGVLMFGLVQSASSRIVSNTMNLWQVLAIYDIAGISYQERVNLLPANLYPEADLQMIDECYTPLSVAILWRFSKGIKPLTDDDDLKVLRNTWGRLIVGHPAAYLAHRWAVSKELIGLSAKRPSGGVPKDTLISHRLELECRQSEVARAVVGAFLELSRDSLLYRPFAYLILSVILLGALIWLRIENRALAVALLFSGLLHMLGLFFATGSRDFRYSHWMILCTVLALAITVRDKAMLGRGRQSRD